MPIYEYECKNCGHKLEELQKISEDPLLICPECGKETLSKLVSNTSFQLKGTGWYATDFKDKAERRCATSQKTKSPGEKHPET